MDLIKSDKQTNQHVDALKLLLRRDKIIMK